mmetsp:Transcript_73316/g.238609  ORF Transcript_73316/g.238609 Transcript_73316/m.238609 type:complete len:342 (+) Transcript_73316:1299-2324(+)
MAHSYDICSLGAPLAHPRLCCPVILRSTSLTLPPFCRWRIDFRTLPWLQLQLGSLESSFCQIGQRQLGHVYSSLHLLFVAATHEHWAIAKDASLPPLCAELRRVQAAELDKQLPRFMRGQLRLPLWILAIGRNRCPMPTVHACGNVVLHGAGRGVAHRQPLGDDDQPQALQLRSAQGADRVNAGAEAEEHRDPIEGIGLFPQEPNVRLCSDPQSFRNHAFCLDGQLTRVHLPVGGLRSDGQPVPRVRHGAVDEQVLLHVPDRLGLRPDVDVYVLLVFLLGALAKIHAPFLGRAIAVCSEGTGLDDRVQFRAVVVVVATVHVIDLDVVQIFEIWQAALVPNK